MADTTALKNRIRAAVKANDNQEITGPVLQQSLLDIVDELNGATETEASARQSGDSTLQQGINTERQARIDADDALGQLITGIKNNIDKILLKRSVTPPSSSAFWAFSNVLKGKTGWIRILNASTALLHDDTTRVSGANFHSDNFVYYDFSALTQPQFYTIAADVSKDVVLEFFDEPSILKYILENKDNIAQINITLNALGVRMDKADDALGQLITGIKNNIDNGYVYAGIATPSTVPVSGKVFYIATAAGTYTNFGNQALTQGINILCYNGSVWSNQQLIGIDDVPTTGSDNLIKSGGVATDVVNLYTLLKPTTIGIKGDSSIEYRINTTDCTAITLLIKNTSDKSGYFRIARYDASGNRIQGQDISINSGESYSRNVNTSEDAYIIITSINSRTGELTVTKDTNAIDNIKDLDKRTIDNENGVIFNKNILIDRVIPTDIYGYISTNGLVNVQTSGNNRCSDFFLVEQGSVIEYSGYYPSGGFPAVYGYDENKQPVTRLLPAGPQYTNYIITIDNTSIRYVRAWGDISEGVLSIKVLAQHDISEIDTTTHTLWNDFNARNISTDLFGYITSEGSIKIQTSGNNHRTDYIPVEQGDRILYTGYDSNRMSVVYGYDENKSPIAKLLASGDWTNKIVEIDDSTVKYVMAWGSVSNHNLSVKILPKYNAKKLSTIEIVDANGNGDYLTLEEAIWNNISDIGDVTKHRTIIVMPGVYTMNTYYGSSAYFWKVIKNRNLSIIGVDRNACILKNTKGKYVAGNNRIDDACLKLSGNVLIKNLTLLASHEDFDGAEDTHPGAYCIHLDSGGADCNLEIDNCIMSNKQQACIGIGTADNYTIQIRNCKLITNVDDPSSFTSWSGAIICHNNNYNNAATLRLENNVMKSNTPNTLAISRNGSYTSQIKLEAYRNIIGGNVSIDSGIVVLDELNFGNNKSELNYQS